MGTLILDAGVVIGMLDRRDTHHAAATAAIRAARDRGDQCSIPASAYAEVLVRPMRLGDEAVAIVEAAIDAIPATITPIDREIAWSAGRLRATHGLALRLPDAMILASAIVAKADRVLTTDGGLVDRGVDVDLISGSA